MDDLNNAKPKINEGTPIQETGSGQSSGNDSGMEMKSLSELNYCMYDCTT